MSENKHPPFEVIVERNITNGDIPVRWCITPEFVQKMQQDNIIDPHILFCACTQNGQEMSRQLVPISQLMTYVRFTHAGEMLLHAWIVDCARGRSKAKMCYTGKTDGTYHTDLIYSNSDPRNNIKGTYISLSHNVSVPAEAFGKEPPKWLKWYVNLWHSRHNRIQDECHFRKRFLLSLLKLIPFAIWTTILMVIRLAYVALMLLVGFRKTIQWRHILHPYNTLIRMVVDRDVQSLDAQDYLHEYRTRWGVIPQFFTIIFTPIFFVLFFCAGLYVEHGSISEAALGALVMMMVFSSILLFCNAFVALVIVLDSTILWYAIEGKWRQFDGWMADNDIWPRAIGWFTLGVGLLMLLLVVKYWMFFTAALLIVSLILSAAYGTIHISKWVTNKVNGEINDPSAIRELLCPADISNLKPDFDLIPDEQKTIRLRFLTLKNKVCKPMQQ